jgi:hypothetical protein
MRVILIEGGKPKLMQSRGEGLYRYGLLRKPCNANLLSRLALLCFMWDTQHAVLFSQSLCMNAAELKLTLPWSESLWQAETAEEWHRLYLAEQAQPLYLSVLKSYINSGLGPRPQSLNALSRVLILHGLMSVAWDLNRRDQTSLGRPGTIHRI